MSYNTYIQTILSCFTSMDIAKLRLHLKDEYSYQEVTKAIFLNEVENVFESFKKDGNTELIIYPGKCVGEHCSNCGLKGYRFVGNETDDYLDLLFDTEGEDIKDIFDCSFFKTDVEQDHLGSQFSIYFNLDDRITFERTPDYWTKVYAASSAYNEIISRPPRRINFEELSYWVEKHGVTDELIGSYDIFNSRMSWTGFSKLYDDLKKLQYYISRYIHDIRQANSLKNLLKTDQELIAWIFANEALYEATHIVMPDSFEKQGDCFIFNMQNQFMLWGEEFDSTYGFVNFYRDNHEKLFYKYTTYLWDEVEELCEKVGWGKDSDDLFSLRFHLENRKVKEESGIHIPLYINEEKNVNGDYQLPTKKLSITIQEMIEENIVYKQIDNKFHFCYYSIGTTIDEREILNTVLYCCQFNQGEVGEINEFECEIDEDKNVLKKLIDQVIETYDIKQIPSQEIEVSVNLNDMFGRISKKKKFFLIDHLSRAIDYVSKTSGLGINNFITPKNKVVLESGFYKTAVTVYDRNAFKKLFIEHITPCGIKEEEVTFSF